MAEQKKTSSIVFGLLLAAAVVAWIIFYFAVHQPLTGEADSLRDQVTQLENRVNELSAQLSEAQPGPETAGVAAGEAQKLGEVYFYSGFAQFTSDSKTLLNEIAAKLRSYPEGTIRVVGHADAVPVGARLKTRYSSNWELSLDRAFETAKLLYTVTDADPTRFEIIGKSSVDPQATNEDQQGRARNRRAAVYIITR